MVEQLEKSIIGCLVGAAVGDALGLPMEGVSRKRQEKLFRDIRNYHMLFGKGMISDDTEHICMVAESLAGSAGDEDIFSRQLASRFRRWFFSLPPAIGMATLRSLIKLSVGFSPAKSGVFSAGNGPAMRSAIIGICYGDDPERMQNLVRVSTGITHTDPKAFYGALAVAQAASMSHLKQVDPDAYLNLPFPPSLK